MDHKEKVEVSQTLIARGIVPFTSGLIPFIYAFFWPESFWRWLGTMVQAFRSAAGM